MLMEMPYNDEDREEQLRRYRLCLEEFNTLEFHDTYVAQIKQEYLLLKELMEEQQATVAEPNYPLK